MHKTLVLAISLLLPLGLAVQGTAESQPVKAPAAAKAEKKKLTCEACQMNFKNAKEAKAHFKKAHGMSFYCSACNHAFKTKEEMMAHARADHPKFQCCGKGFMTEAELKAHKKEAHGGN